MNNNFGKFGLSSLARALSIGSAPALRRAGRTGSGKVPGRGFPFLTTRRAPPGVAAHHTPPPSCRRLTLSLVYIYLLCLPHNPTRIPLRVFFGPQLSLPLPTLESTLLSVPALSRNFLISPPGSPPVGWEQTLEEAPNSQTHAHDADDGAAGAWGDELARALRFLSVSGGGDEDDDGEVQPVPSRRRANLGLDSDEEDDGEPTTSVVLPHNVVGATARPAVTVSTPAAAAASGPGTDGATPPAGAAKITAVKATIESLLGRKRSFSGLERPKLESPGASTPTFGASLLGGSKITPTARPPVGLVRDFVE